MKKPITQREYNILFDVFKELENRQETLRQAHVDANNEGDQRECDAWSVTDRLSKQNAQKMEEISEFLLEVEIVENMDTDKIQDGITFKMSIDGNIGEYLFCSSITVQFIDNGISGDSIVGREIKGKKKGFKKEIELTERKSVEVEIVEVCQDI